MVTAALNKTDTILSCPYMPRILVLMGRLTESPLSEFTVMSPRY